jgi:hypothetical protein
VATATPQAKSDTATRARPRAATKDGAWERRGPIWWAGLGHPVSFGLQAAAGADVEWRMPVARAGAAFPPPDGARAARG